MTTFIAQSINRGSKVIPQGYSPIYGAVLPSSWKRVLEVESMTRHNLLLKNRLLMQLLYITVPFLIRQSLIFIVFKEFIHKFARTRIARIQPRRQNGSWIISSLFSPSPKGFYGDESLLVILL